jgi:FkbM family methyltransferase
VAKTDVGTLYVTLHDAVEAGLLLNGAFEIETLRLIRGLLRPECCFVDLGANVGQYTLAAAEIVGPRGQVIAFEPNPEICVALRANLALNTFASNVIVVVAAAVDTERLAWFSNPPPGNSGQSREAESPSQGSFVVSGMRVSNVIHELNIQSVDVVKVDVEGNELSAIRGLLEGTLRPAHIVFEFDPLQFSYEDEQSDLLTFLGDRGYEILHIDGRKFRAGDPAIETNLWAKLR